ncbi:MAG: ABC transporter permease subunit [Actinomycetota bacterium]|nr:ABC transporter permease subunit [Actinomycetota bacterium]
MTRRVPRRARPWVGALVAIGIWELVAVTNAAGPQFLASVPAVARVAGDSPGELLRALGGTLQVWAIALAISFVGAVVLGIVVASLPLLDQLGEWVVRSSRSVPALALIPVTILLFGLTTTMEAILVVAAAFWPIFVNTAYAVRRYRVEHREKARALQLRRWSFYRRIVVPASAPMIASGTRAAIGLSMAATIAVELVVGYGGLGGLVLTAEQAGNTPLIYAGVLLGGLAGWLVNRLFVAGQQRLLAWAYRPGVATPLRARAAR